MFPFFQHGLAKDPVADLGLHPAYFRHKLGKRRSIDDDIDGSQICDARQQGLRKVPQGLPTPPFIVLDIDVSRCNIRACGDIVRPAVASPVHVFLHRWTVWLHPVVQEAL
mmetsp:Transcript_6222/g.11122  ORF Transcript_6222/g.11122 Transcript_6222/m.11122 type:complete len:110 (-) Transcript_6222:815-1144(-)